MEQVQLDRMAHGLKNMDPELMPRRRLPDSDRCQTGAPGLPTRPRCRAANADQRVEVPRFLATRVPRRLIA